MRKFRCRCCGACCRIKDGIVRVGEVEIARIAIRIWSAPNSRKAKKTLAIRRTI